ncbi:fructose-bisphosphate aldolase [Steroidobacter denitrificans]|uniref:Fructose-bisphosphate aldolase n=1 Tax=Steroidobacter denitrificans TaxID=465721 RepID=A0A127FDC3_STEDE|nr:class I fructose-bisphosphate aldolase [Steroidobacter denitrificans]AMN47609.1 fructose-bisphosphate aldolase [Steroidobacter denitrificans]
MNRSELETIARAMVAKGKGILAADESSGTIKKRFDNIKVESTQETRRSYRELLFTAPAAADYISGVILYDETIRQKTKDGTPFPQYLQGLGILPGIKVDMGAKALAGFPKETITEGLDGLRERLAEYHGLGARFAKWRAVIDIAEDIPTAFAIEANAHALARYAALCQEAGIVPIVEPEVLMDGGHTLERCEEVTNQVLAAVFAQLHSHRIHLEGTILKPNMVISGKKCPMRAAAQQVAEATIRCLRRHVPSAVPGIAFLSGGQSSPEATEHLNRMNVLGPHPWELTFSYGRALQEEALQAWGGKPENVEAGQKAFLRRAKFNGLARSGAYDAKQEQAAA